MYKAAAFVLSALLKAGHGASLASEARTFTLYAYGEGIGGLPIFAQGSTFPPLLLFFIIFFLFSS